MGNQVSERVVNGIKTRVLHGKDYVEVAERLRIVHQRDGDFEQTDIQQFSIGDRWFIRCFIKVNGRQYMGTAEIKFNAPKNTPDGTNPLECAETSALGRALAFAGLGTVESIASYEEIIRGQPFSKIVEQAPGQMVDSNAPRLPEPQEDETIKSTTKALYDAALKLKKRAIEQNIITNDEEWKAMLDYLEIEQFASGSDLAKVNSKMAETLKACETKAS